MNRTVRGLVVAAMMQAGSGAMAEEVKMNTFGEDVAFLSKHADVVVLSSGDARVAVTPAFQGRVMTSTTGGDDGPSFGWLNYKVIEAGVLEAEKARGRLEEHIYVFGGEERFWVGPEGGQFSIYFKPGAKYDFAAWKVPAFIDTEPFKLAKQSPSSARFTRDVEVMNNTGTVFRIGIERTVSLLTPAQAQQALGIALPAGVKAVAYETDNRITNQGEKPWTKETGLLSIWMLGMYKPSPGTTVAIPFKSGPEADLGPKVNDTYFGKVPPEYLVVKDDVLFFKGDGTHRSKIGISPKRSKGIAGSYDAGQKLLTLVTYNVPETHEGYVNSMWEHQQDPFSGDVINSYNDGSPEPGKPPLGPFYELETSSPAAALGPGKTMKHVQRTFHLQGDEAALDAIARKTLGVGLADIAGAFAK